MSPEYCKLFAYKKAYKGGVTGTQDPPLATPMIVAHNPLFEFKTPHISKFSWSWVKHYHGLTHVNTAVRDLQARIVHVIATSRTSTPISLQSSIL